MSIETFSGGRRKTLAFFILLIVLSLAAPSYSSVEQEKKKLRDLQDKIKDREKQLGEIKRKETSLLQEMEEINTSLYKNSSELARNRAALKETNQKITSTKYEISRLNFKIDERRKWLKSKLRAIYRYGNFGDSIVMLASAENTAQLLRRVEYLHRLARFEKNVISSFKQELLLVEEKQAALLELGKQQTKQEQAVKTAMNALGEKKKEKESLLGSIKHEKSLHMQIIREMEDSSRRLTDIIRDAEEKEKHGRQQPSTNFRELKGKLPWPAKGSIAIPYGKQKDPQFSTMIFRNGIYIKTDDDTVAKSVNAGKVVYTGAIKGFGRVVILNHGDGYHSLYANLSEIFLKVGDIIKRDDEIGKTGVSALIDAPTLYFEIRYKGKPLDPIQWLSRR